MSYAEAEHLFFPVDEEDYLAPPLAGVSLLDLSNRQCRWPLGDMIEPAMRFCGHDAPIGSPYCAAHRAVAYLGFPRAATISPPRNT